MTPSRKTLFRGLSLAALLCAAAVPTRTAHAQVLHRFALHVEGGGGVGPRQSFEPMPNAPAANAILAGRLGITLVDPLALTISGGARWFFPGFPDPQTEPFVTAGLRLEPQVGRLGRLFFDVNLGPSFLTLTSTNSVLSNQQMGAMMGMTPAPQSSVRFAIDAGMGLEFSPTQYFHVGPFVRYTYINPLATMSGERSGWSFGVSLAIRAPAPTAPTPPPAPRDTDGDGVLDPDDQCPSEPQGEHPDANRRGCPVRDTDGDGILDDADQCVNEPQGAHPNPERAGCPDGDADSDGVLDHDDQCRDTPAGAHPNPERAGCPDGDQDNDGVLDHDDQCRDVAAGPTPDPARAGCPIPDRDHDTVPDNVDHCPDQPGAPSPDPNRNGCPGLVTVQSGQIRISRQVFFANNSANILPPSFPVLQAVADSLRASPQIRRVSVDGHTDDVGNDAANMTLSQRRAESVVRWLTQHQVEATRLEAHGYGETRPLDPIQPRMAPPALAAARGRNRRVEFNIVDPAQGGSVSTPAGGASAPPAGAAPSGAAPSAPPAAGAPATGSPAAGGAPAANPPAAGGTGN